ncbi:hypothetical protein BJ878DRAFT_399267, partial [Calycina marina]
YPTLSITAKIKSGANRCKWLFLRIQNKEVRKGRFDTDIVILNEEGMLVALRKHVSLA